MNALALDSSGAAYIAGQTTSPDLPTSATAPQPALPSKNCTRPQASIFTVVGLNTHAFVAKLAADGSSLAWSTFLSGSCGSIVDSIVVDPTGQAIVGGYTDSADYPATANAYQAAFPGQPDQVTPPNPLSAGFITRLSAAGDKVMASSYLGGGYATQVNALALDSKGNVALTGLTMGIAPGTTPGAYQPKFVDRCTPTFSIGPSPPYVGTSDAFVMKLDPMLSTAQFLTYLGGGCSDAGTGITLDPFGDLWVTGYTQSPDFPLIAPFQTQGLSGRFVSELNQDGTQLLYSSATDGVALDVVGIGAVYLVGSKTNGSMGAELMKIDPAPTSPIEIDHLTPVNVFPQTLLSPTAFGTGLAPGQLITITGKNLGPTKKADAQLDSSKRLPVLLSGTSVSFDGIPAPLLSVQDTAIQCFVPFEVSQSTLVSALVNGTQSNSVRVGVTSIDPHILSIANQDGTLNSSANPAKPGSVVVIYASGLGTTFPASADGLVTASGSTKPVFQVSVYLGNMMVKPQFLGAAPGMIAGITQINLAIPTAASSSNAMNVAIGAAGGVIYVAQ